MLARFWALLLVFQPLALAGDFRVTVKTPAGATLEDAAIVLQSLDAKRAILGKKPASIEQKDRDFHPYLTIVQRGAAIDFPNRDPVKHHVYSFSPAKTFELKLYAGQPVDPVLFDKAGAVVLGCNVHDWMQAFVLVVDSPYFAKTGPDGIANVTDVPAGRYLLQLWHPRQLKSVAGQEIVLGGKSPPPSSVVLAASPLVVQEKPELKGNY